MPPRTIISIGLVRILKIHDGKGIKVRRGWREGRSGMERGEGNNGDEGFQ
jgi:hypothetical protein